MWFVATGSHTRRRPRRRPAPPPPQTGARRCRDETNREALQGKDVQPTATEDLARRPSVTAKRVVGGARGPGLRRDVAVGSKQQETGNERGVETAVAGS